MTTTRFERFLPLAGVLGGLLFAAVAVLTVNEPSITDGEQKYARWFADHQATGIVSGVAAGYFCVLMVLFATGVRRALLAGERGSSAHAGAALAGGVVAASGLALMGILMLANTEAADKHNPQAVISLGYLDDAIWLLFIAGLAVFYFAAGLGSLRTGVLPKWLAIVTVVIAVLCLAGPAGMVVFYATPVWMVLTGALLYRRETIPTLAPQSSKKSAVGAL